MGECTRHGYSLLFSTGKVIRERVSPIFEAHRLEQLVDAFFRMLGIDAVEF